MQTTPAAARRRQRPAHSVVSVAALALLLGMPACGGGGGDAADATPAGTEQASAAANVDATDSSAPAPMPAQTACAIPDFAAAALAAVNQRRAAAATCGSRGNFAAAPPLRWSALLATASAGHTIDMAAQNYFSHTSADGRSMSDRVNATGYAWASLGENIAAGYPGIERVVEGWMRSDGHCANIMNPAFDEMGLACMAGASGSGPYWTQNLARKR